MTYAQSHGVIVQFFFFTAIYSDTLWNYNPMKSTNNINGVGSTGKENAYTVTDTTMLNIQKALVAKIVTELNEYNNLMWEVSNEPYTSGMTMTGAWEDAIVQTIVDTEAALTKKHLISENIGNYSHTITSPNPNVDAFFLHYANTSTAYTNNYSIAKILGNDETGFSQDDIQYRQEAWIALCSGAAYFNVLDYSFTVGDEDGTTLPAGNPSGGTDALRKQLVIAMNFIKSFNFVNMTPDNSILVANPSGATTFILKETGVQYAIFIRNGSGSSTLQITLPSGTYNYSFINTKTGATISSGSLTHGGGTESIPVPSYSEDVALKILY